MKKFVLSGIACLITAMPLAAKEFDWEQIAHTPDGLILYADNNFYDGQDFAWIIVKEPEPFKTPEGNSADSTMLKIHINCEKNLMKMADTAYLKNNKVIETDNEAKENTYKKIKADTMFSLVANWFCSS